MQQGPSCVWFAAVSYPTSDTQTASVELCMMLPTKKVMTTTFEGCLDGDDERDDLHREEREVSNTRIDRADEIPKGHVW